MPKHSQTCAARQSELINGHLVASVDQAISDLFGAGVVDAFYLSLETGGVFRKDIADKLNQFCSVVEQTFGTSALVIERAIAKRLFSKLGLSSPPLKEQD